MLPGLRFTNTYCNKRTFDPDWTMDHVLIRSYYFQNMGGVIVTHLMPNG